MKTPYIRIELDDGTSTNVTVCPVDVDGYIPGQLHYAVEEALGRAFSMFMRGLVQDEDSLNERLAPLRLRSASHA